MNIFINFFSLLIENPVVLFSMQFLCISSKLFLLCFLVFKGLQYRKIPVPLFYLIGALSTGIIADSPWLLLFMKQYLNLDQAIMIFTIRIAWAFNELQYLTIGYFIESLGERNYKIKLYQIILSLITFSFIAYFLFIAFFHFSIITIGERTFEIQVIKFCFRYLNQILILVPLYFTIRKLYLNDFPKILRRQLTILTKYILILYSLIHIPKSISVLSDTHHAVFNFFSTPLLTFAFFYAIFKVMGIRFLNFQKQVQAKLRVDFMNDFTLVLEKLSEVSNIKEFGHVTQTFFKDSFGLIPNRTRLFFRRLEMQRQSYKQEDPILAELIIEQCVNTKDTPSLLYKAFKEQKIIIYDDIIFNNFYEDDQLNRELVQFMDRINADIFLPLFDRKTLVAYIIIDRHSRLGALYSNAERDEMIVFGRYLGSLISLLHQSNLNCLLQGEKELREEIYNKHQEISQYRESIRSFVHENKQRKIGVIFYKNKRFSFGNKDAEEFININLNASDGHHLTKEIKKLVNHVQEYKSSDSCLVKDAAGERTLVISALMHTESNSVIVMVYYPELSDVLRQQVERLHNPSEWDYLLYLETTKSGQLINQLIPSSGTHLLNFKIELLKVALSKKALLLQMPDDDLMPTVEILHHISVREQLHVLNLTGPVNDSSIAISLFGINPLLAPKNSEPLLEKLNNTGTLFIQNIHFLDPESQQYLAEYIKYGFYQVYKSDQRVTSNVRIICSTNQNLNALMQENRFSKQLYQELKHTTLTMPSLVTLPEHELNELTQGFSDQAITTPLLNNLLELSPKEKHKLIHSKPLSLHEFKEKIRTILLNKSKQSNIYEETYFDPAYNVADPVLVEAAKMGKKALQDPKIMGLLWNKFNKNQNKIATFLGVNRSSVNRRCKDYNLE